MSGLPCTDCFSGAVHLGEPSGTVTTIHGLPTYVAQPPEGFTPKGVVVFITDVFGWEFVNSRILADQYAKNGGFLVYVPDFTNGSFVSPKGLTLAGKIMQKGSWFTTMFYKPFYTIKAIFLFLPFVIRNRASVAIPRIFNFFKELRTGPPPFPSSNLKVAVAGFCWGGLYTVYLAQDQPSSRVVRHASQGSSSALRPLIDCAFTAHPSMLNVPEDIDGVTVPLSVAVGDVDRFLSSPKILQMKEILQVKNRGDHEVVIMPGATHGFAVRSHSTDEYQLKCAAEAEKQAINWFSKWLL